MTNTKHEESNLLSATYFLESETFVHIKKKSGEFFNGIIVDVSKNKDFFVIDDRVAGKKIVLFKELSRPIEEYKKRGENDGTII